MTDDASEPPVDEQLDTLRKGSYRVADATDAPSPTRLRVVSWNIAYGARAERVLDALSTRLRGDILMLQEVDRLTKRTRDRGSGERRDVADLFARSLRMDYVYGPEFRELRQERGRIAAFTGQQTLSRYPLAEATLRRFEHQPADWSRGMLAIVQRRHGGRMFLYASADVAGRRVHLYNTHLESRAKDAGRALQMGELLRDVAERVPPEEPVVIAGDFNVDGGDESPVIRALVREGFSDPLLGRDPADVTTNRQGNKRLDWVFSRGLSVLDASISSDFEGSDHRAVSATYTLG